jgi:uncharacterized phage protein gp47/JayE
MFERPSLADLISRIETDIQTRLTGSGAPLRRSVVSVLARAQAGALYLAYGFISWISRQITPLTADGDKLDDHGTIWGLDRKIATFAEGPLNIFGASAGIVVPAGSVFVRSDGVEFETLADVTLTLSPLFGPAATASVRSLTAGVVGNTGPLVEMDPLSPIVGITGAAVPETFEIAGGADRESDSDYRVRILDKIRRPPSGGSANDYKQWATAIPGVSDAVVFPLAYGPGTVLVTVGNWTAEPYTVAGSVLTAVNNSIQEKRPVTAAVTVANVVPADIGLQIKLAPNIPEVRSQVENEIRSLFARRARPGSTISKSILSESISKAAGETDHEIITILKDGNTVSSIVLSNLETAVLETIGFSDL